VPIAPMFDYTDARLKAFSYERLRPPLLHRTYDGLERLSENCLRGQAVT
jgi:hypothetical protein